MESLMPIIEENQGKYKKEFESKISQVVKLETQMLDFLQNSKINEVHRDLKACKQSIDKDHMAINEKIQKMDENLKKVMEMEQQNIGSTRNVDTSSPEENPYYGSQRYYKDVQWLNKVKTKQV